MPVLMLGLLIAEEIALSELLGENWDKTALIDSSCCNLSADAGSQFLPSLPL